MSARAGKLEGADARQNVAGMESIDVSGLEPDAVRVIELIVQRLRFGQATYGPLDLSTNPRNWRLEASEEFIDAAVYSAMKALKDDDERRADAVMRSTSATETRLFRAYCTPRELDWLDVDLPRLKAAVRAAEGTRDMDEARRVALEILKGKRDLIETVQKRMDGDA